MRASIDKMFTIIENNEHFLWTQIIAQHVNDRALWFVKQSNCHRGGAWNKKGVENRSKFGQPHAVRIILQYSLSSLNRKTGFSNPTRSYECHKMILLEEIGNLLFLLLAPDETGQRNGQIRLGFSWKRISRAFWKPCKSSRKSQPGLTFLFGSPQFL
jgi:hypothetical protein